MCAITIFRSSGFLGRSCVWFLKYVCASETSSKYHEDIKLASVLLIPKLREVNVVQCIPTNVSKPFMCGLCVAYRAVSSSIDHLKLDSSLRSS